MIVDSFWHNEPGVPFTLLFWRAVSDAGLAIRFLLNPVNHYYSCGHWNCSRENAGRQSVERRILFHEATLCFFVYIGCVDWSYDFYSCLSTMLFRLNVSFFILTTMEFWPLGATTDPGVCGLSSFVLEFFLLAAAGWYLCDGIDLYYSITNPFSSFKSRYS